MKIIQSADSWSKEALAKYGSGAVQWLKRWKINLANYPKDLTELDKAIEQLEAQVGV